MEDQSTRNKREPSGCHWNSLRVGSESDVDVWGVGPERLSEIMLVD